MEEKRKVIDWEKVNETLVKKIENFYLEYESAHKQDFEKDEFKAHSKMLRISGKIFKREIESQVSQLVKLNQSFLTQISD